MKKQKAGGTSVRQARLDPALHRALATGVLQWLCVADAVRLLSASNSLRQNASLAEYALVHCAKDGRHFFQQCARDWFHVITPCRRNDEQSEGGELSCTRCHKNDTNDNTPRMQACVRTLTMVGELEAQMEPYVKSGGDPFAVRALLVPVLPTSSTTLESALDIQCRAVAGQKSGRPSPLAAHWENIALGDKDRADAVVCKLCNSCVNAICAYREETEVFAKRFEELLVRQEEVWERAGWSEADICELAFNFQQAYYTKEPFYNTYIADADDSGILRYLCARGRLKLPCYIGKTCELQAGEFDPLSVQSRASCRTLYQPFRAFLAQHKVTNMRHYDISTKSQHSRALGLITGSSPAAIIGMYIAS